MLFTSKYGTNFGSYSSPPRLLQLFNARAAFFSQHTPDLGCQITAVMEWGRKTPLLLGLNGVHFFIFVRTLTYLLIREPCSEAIWRGKKWSLMITERLNGLIIWFSATSSCLDPQRCFMRQQTSANFLCSLSLSCMLHAADRSCGKNASRVISTGELITHVAYLSSLWHLWLFNVIYYETKYWKRANSEIICDPLTDPRTHARMK